MDTALIVALIGVGGTVIVAGLNFWQSRTNLAAANTREREQREEADKIHAEDREERERDRSRADEAAKRARADVWREERVNAHRAALSLLTQINDQFLKAKYDLTSPWKLAEPYSVDQLRQALRDLTLAQSDVELYGSRVSAAALAACAGEAVLITKDFEMYDGNYRAENPKRDWFKDRNLFERMDEFAGNRSAYLIAAKEDIGTLDY